MGKVIAIFNRLREMVFRITVQQEADLKKREKYFRPAHGLLKKPSRTL